MIEQPAKCRAIALIADRVAFVDSWVDRGIDHAIELYEDALREAGLLR